MNTRDHAPIRTRGFTLIELLIVIAIIAILATLTVATTGKLVDKGRRTQARTVMHSLELAIKSYQTENSKLPAVSQPRPTEDNEEGYDTSAQNGRDLLDILMGKNTAANPKQIPHFSPPAAAGDAGYTNARGLIDIWGQQGYRIILDYDGDGQIADPYDSAAGDTVYSSVIIYCAASNKQFDTGSAAKSVDDLKSW